MDSLPRLGHGPGPALQTQASAPTAATPQGDRVLWGWLDLLKIVGMLLLMGIVTVILVAVIHALFRSRLDTLLPVLHASGLSGKLAGILVFSFAFYGLLAFTIYLCVVRKYELGLPALGFRPTKLSSLALAVAAWLVVGIVGGAATALMAQLFLGGHFSNAQTKDFSNTGATRSILSLLLLLVSLGVVVPIVEETLFRGLLFPLLHRKLPYVAAVTDPDLL